MPLTIWKWTIDVALEPTVCEFPSGAQLGKIELQQTTICLWALCDPEAPKVAVPIYVHGTGHAIPATRCWLGSCQDGPLVWHLFVERDDAVAAGLGVPAFLRINPMAECKAFAEAIRSGAPAIHDRQRRIQ